MSGFFALDRPSDSALLSTPKVRSVDDRDPDELDARLNRILANPQLRVLAVSAVGAVSESWEEGLDVVHPRYFATVIYQERLLPNGPENGDEAP